MRIVRRASLRRLAFSVLASRSRVKLRRPNRERRAKREEGPPACEKWMQTGKHRKKTPKWIQAFGYRKIYLWIYLYLYILMGMGSNIN